MEKHTLLFYVLLIQSSAVVLLNGAPLDKDTSYKNESALDEETHNALMASLPILRYVNSRKNFRVKFRDTNADMTPTIHIIQSSSKNPNNLEKNSKENLSNISTPSDSQNSNYKVKESRRINLNIKSPNNSNQYEHTIKAANLKGDIKENNKNEETVNSLENNNCNKSWHISDDVIQSAKINNMEEIIIDEDEQSDQILETSEPFFNNSIKYDTNENNGDNEYWSTTTQPQLAEDEIKLNIDDPSFIITVIGNDSNDESNNNLYYENTKEEERHDLEAADLQREINTLDIYSKLSDIENILNVSDTNHDFTKETSENIAENSTVNDLINNKSKNTSEVPEILNVSLNGNQNPDILSAPLNNNELYKTNTTIISNNYQNQDLSTNTLFENTSLENQQVLEIPVEVKNEDLNQTMNNSMKVLNISDNNNTNETSNLQNTNNQTQQNNENRRLPSRGRGSFKYNRRPSYVQNNDEDLLNQNYPKETIEKIIALKKSELTTTKPYTVQINLSDTSSNDGNALRWITIKPASVKSVNENERHTSSLQHRRGRNNTLSDSNVLNIKKNDVTSTNTRNKISESYIHNKQDSEALNKYNNKEYVTLQPINYNASYEEMFAEREISTEQTQESFPKIDEIVLKTDEYRRGHNNTLSDSNVVDIEKTDVTSTNTRNNISESYIHNKEDSESLNKSNVKEHVTFQPIDYNVSYEDVLTESDISTKKSQESFPKTDEFVLKTDESSYYGNNKNDTSINNIEENNSKYVTTKITESNEYTSSTYFSYSQNYNTQSYSESSTPVSRNGRRGSIGDRGSTTRNSNEYTNIENNEENINVNSDTSSNGRRRGSKKFSSSRFETISPFLTDSMTNKIFGVSQPTFKINNNNINSYTTTTTERIVNYQIPQTINENDIAEVKTTNVNDKPYRGSIKFKYEPRQYDWYDDGLNESNFPLQFEYAYKAPNDTDVHQKGFLKVINKRKVFEVHGSYQYTAPDGTPIYVTYTADEFGFHPKESKVPILAVKNVEKSTDKSSERSENILLNDVPFNIQETDDYVAYDDEIDDVQTTEINTERIVNS